MPLEITYIEQIQENSRAIGDNSSGIAANTRDIVDVQDCVRRNRRAIRNTSQTVRQNSCAVRNLAQTVDEVAQAFENRLQVAERHIFQNQRVLHNHHRRINAIEIFVAISVIGFIADRIAALL